MKAQTTRRKRCLYYLFLGMVSAFFVLPILLVLMNSLKGKLYISATPFAFPNKETFVGLQNYAVGLAKVHFYRAAVYSFFITIGSVLLIVLFCSMCAWIITRIRAWWCDVIYFVLVASMVIPFQMTMFPLTKLADSFGLTSLAGMCVIYLGMGSTTATFMFSGFVKGIPIEMEEAAMIDGANPAKSFAYITFPVLKPITITVAIINTMWIWNDFLLPYLIIGANIQTIPIAIQNMKMAFGSIDYGHLMAAIIAALVPVVLFYFCCQKYIIEGIVSGAVKG